MPVSYTHLRYTRFNHQAGAVQKLDFDGLQIDLENPVFAQLRLDD